MEVGGTAGLRLELRMASTAGTPSDEIDLEELVRDNAASAVGNKRSAKEGLATEGDRDRAGLFRPLGIGEVGVPGAAGELNCPVALS